MAGGHSGLAAVAARALVANFGADIAAGLAGSRCNIVAAAGFDFVADIVGFLVA